MAESRAGSHILWIGDELAHRQSLEIALEPLAHHLIQASSGQEALEHLLHQEFAAVLLDVRVLAPAHFELARLIRQRTPSPHPPFIVLSDPGLEPRQVVQAYEAGAVDVLFRPVDAEILRAKVSVCIDLHTAHRRSTEQLRFQENILRNVHDSIIVTDFSGRIIHWSRGAQVLFGYSVEEMLGQTPAMLYPEQDTSGLSRDLSLILEGKDFVGEWRGRRKDGADIWVDITTSLMRDADGHAMGFIGVGRNITARKRAEQKLHFLSDASRLLEDSGDGVDALLERVARLAADSVVDICTVDLLQEDGTLRRVTVAHRDPQLWPLLQQGRRFAHRSDSISRLHLALESGKVMLFTPEDIAQSTEHLQLIEALGVHSIIAAPLHGQQRLLGLMLLSACKPSVAFDGEALEMAEELARRVAGALETRRLFREAQEAVHQAEREKRTAEIFSRLGLAFASELDRDKLVQRVTDEATELTGAAFGAFFHNLTNDEGESYLLYTLSGVPREAFSRFPMPRNTRIFGPTFAGTATVRLDDVTRSPDYGQNPPYRGMPEGHLPVRSYLAVPVKGRTGEVLGGLFFGHPEPGRFRKEHEQLVEGLAAQAAVALDNSLLYRKAQLAVSLRDEFLQVAAHELRTPTTSLKLHVQSLLRAASAEGPVVSPERLRTRLEEVERIVSKLGVLINELLDISRITAGSLHVTWEEVDLAAVVREVALRFEAQAAQTHSPMNIAAEAPIIGRWDKLRLEQVVTNLLSNALKYGAGGRVYLNTSVDGTRARLTVRDEGIGIAPEALSRIFGRFERAVSERHYGGLGLGLYITRQIVAALGGTVRVESTPGKGATFTVELPMAPAAARK
ncbi:ATP-binding protein [Hyalangium versicolor]|uniref:ATP-binding protein n=1 Tax=Hyalangium versicolor TaxID=2861190 RepID=UPI001CCB9FA0|nr:ATP-binding protein [Hyalangium versicolor]